MNPHFPGTLNKHVAIKDAAALLFLDSVVRQKVKAKIAVAGDRNTHSNNSTV